MPERTQTCLGQVWDVLSFPPSTNLPHSKQLTFPSSWIRCSRDDYASASPAGYLLSPLYILNQEFKVYVLKYVSEVEGVEGGAFQNLLKFTNIRMLTAKVCFLKIDRSYDPLIFSTYPGNVDQTYEGYIESLST